MTNKTVHYSGGVVAESDGVRYNTEARLKAIAGAADQMYAAYNSGQIDLKAFDAGMSRVENDSAAVDLERRNAKAAQKLAGSADSAENSFSGAASRPGRRSMLHIAD